VIEKIIIKDGTFQFDDQESNVESSSEMFIKQVDQKVLDGSCHYNSPVADFNKSNILRVPGLPGRNGLPSLEGRGDVSLAFYRQNRAAPLLFIVAGVGSNPYFGVGRYLAGLFYRAGSHVVILPSPMNWNFA
jgi:hypothetical protein